MDDTKPHYSVLLCRPECSEDIQQSHVVTLGGGEFGPHVIGLFSLGSGVDHDRIGRQKGHYADNFFPG